jgi:CheY-like chemotaxis protein
MINQVLLVDDDREMLLALTEGLARWADSFAVVTAESGAAALEQLRSQEISLVVTDLKMPEMDGLELLAAIMQNYPGTPVIMMTAFGTPEREHLARQSGAVDFITKPFPVDVLARQMALMLKQQSAGGALHNVSSAMFLQLIEMEQKTCTVRLEHRPSGSRGTLFFVNGELYDARAGDLQGLDAVYKIFAWEAVSLTLENICLIRENRIRKNLYPLILEAARRRDEDAASAEAAVPPGGSPLPPPTPVDSLALIRSRIERALGADGGVEEVFQDSSWIERVRRISENGQHLKLGRLTLACVNWGDPRDYIIRPGDPPLVIAVNPKCPREKLMRLLGG